MRRYKAKPKIELSNLPIDKYMNVNIPICLDIGYNGYMLQFVINMALAGILAFGIWSILNKYGE